MELIAGFGGGELIITEDGGSNWRTVQTPKQIESTCFADARNGWVVAESDIYRTTNGAHTWQHVGTAPTAGVGPTSRQGKWIGFACSGGSVLWGVVSFGHGAGSEEWGVYGSQDGGANWAYVGGRISGVSPVNGVGGKTGPWSAVDSGTFYMATTDRDFAAFEGTTGGGPWNGGLFDDQFHVKMGGAQPSRPIVLFTADMYFVSAAKGWIVGRLPSDTNLRLMTTDDGGHTWQGLHVSPEQ